MTRRENGIDCDEHVDARVRFSRLFISLSEGRRYSLWAWSRVNIDIAQSSLSGLLRSVSGVGVIRELL